MKKKLLVAVGVLLMGCTGEMQGLVQSNSGQPLGAAVLTYKTYGLGTATFTVAMPDGEAFQGNASEVTAQADGNSWGYTYNSYGQPVYSNTYSTAEVQTGTMVGSALGNRGHSMQCTFQGETHGTGRCNISDGRVLDLTF